MRYDDLEQANRRIAVLEEAYNALLKAFYQAFSNWQTLADKQAELKDQIRSLLDS